MATIPSVQELRKNVVQTAEVRNRRLAISRSRFSYRLNGVVVQDGHKLSQNLGDLFKKAGLK